MGRFAGSCGPQGESRLLPPRQVGDWRAASRRGDLTLPLLTVALWWPWGGQTVEVRVGQGPGLRVLGWSRWHGDRVAVGMARSGLTAQ